MHPRAVLLRFYRIVSPIHRWLEDESAFANLVDHVHFSFGLGPAYGDPIKAAYFGTERTIAKTRNWIHGWSLKHLLLDEAALPHKLERVFTAVGDSLARYFNKLLSSSSMLLLLLLLLLLSSSLLYRLCYCL